MSRSESLSVPAKLVQTSRFLNCRALYTRIGRHRRARYRFGTQSNRYFRCLVRRCWPASPVYSNTLLFPLDRLPREISSARIPFSVPRKRRPSCVEFVKQWRKGTTIEKSLTKTRHTRGRQESLSKKKTTKSCGSFPFTSVFVVSSLFSSSYFLITTTIQYYNKRVLLCEYPVNKKGWCD